jgi:aldose 1-epimerase
MRILLWLLLLVTTLHAEPIQVGGMDVFRLERKATGQGRKLEFLSVTLLPGRGMNTFQITANLPVKGETALLKSPSLEEAAQQMTGDGKDQGGVLNHSFGGAFLIPFASRITGEVAPDGHSLTTRWQGKTITLPLASGTYATHGLLNLEKVQDLKTHRTKDGETVTGVVHAGDFGGRWLSKTDLHFTIALTGVVVDISITAKNVGDLSEPMGFGWHPYFAIPSGDRTQVQLHVPASRRALVNGTDARTTGEFQSVAGTDFDFRSPQGSGLKDSINVNLSGLDRNFAAWLIDPKSNYGLRVRALSPHIQTLQVYSPKNSAFVAIEDQFNYPDPWGAEWKDIDTGMVALRPGQSVTWRVRLELFQPQRPNKK